MRSDRLWVGIACGVALGLGAVAIVGVSTPSASAQSANFTVSPQQLKINQNISSAAVKRSNRSLNYLAPIRTTQTDNADDGSNGVKPLSGIPGSGQGWVIGQLARGQKQYWASVATNGSLGASSGPTSGNSAFASSTTGTGVYVVDFKTNVSQCSWSANPIFPTTAPSPYLAVTAGVANQPTQVAVHVYNAGVAPSAPVNSAFSVQVLC
jgi:hypothetical protein